ncbi:MAG: family 16 glycoside hydrolase [Bacteroidota bacterium]
MKLSFFNLLQKTKTTYGWITLSLLLLCGACQTTSETAATKDVEKEEIVPKTLPLQQLDFSTATLPANWKEVGQVSSDLMMEKDMQTTDGQGVLVCAGDGEAFTTPFEHGDVELDVQFMVPKNSNSGIYFQGRYELQILDSWKKESVDYADLGGIYGNVRDEASGKASGGFAPSVNAAKAPGLWQHFNVLFRAPKFDETGKKIANAKFEHVYLNGFLIHKDVELETVTLGNFIDGEGPMGPMMIQGDHGPVAFKNFKYKKMGTDTIAISELQYAVYDQHWDKIPDFEGLTPKKTGTTPTFNDLEDLAEQNDKFGMVFTGEIDVPKDGEYLFTTEIDDGGDLYIDDQLIVHNEGDPGMGTERGLVNLTKGKHSLKATYYEEVWGARLKVYVEGPEMPKRELGFVNVLYPWERRTVKRATVASDQRPEIVRGFVDYKGGKKTHALTVGDPAGVHYTYDLMDGALLKGWRGDFADVTNMWVNRGASQTMLPQNASVDFSDGVPIAQLPKPETAWPDFRSSDYKNKGFKLDDSGRPIFLSSYKDVNIEDRMMPSGQGGLKRMVLFQSDKGMNSHWFKVAEGDKIEQLDNGLYSVDGEYYLRFGAENPVSIRNGKELVTAVTDRIVYELIW